MAKTKKVHLFEICDWDRGVQYGYLLCLDPENMNPDRRHESTTRSAEVTCKKCLKKIKT
jgi:hypothetical protein